MLYFRAVLLPVRVIADQDCVNAKPVGSTHNVVTISDFLLVFSFTFLETKETIRFSRVGLKSWQWNDNNSYFHGIIVVCTTTVLFLRVSL